jgi:hypothetical protein
MPIPDVKVSILDGALGLSAGSSSRVQVKLGTASKGTDYVLESLADLSSLKEKFGQGPLVEAAARVLAVAGGPVFCMKVPGSTAGAVGAVTPTKTGTATLAITGAAYDAYDLVLEIVKGAATLVAGTATFRYSLDGGQSFSAEIAVPVSGIYAIPESNVTLTWTYTTGTAFVAGDKWVATSTAPDYSTTDLGTAATALLADPRTWFLLHAVGAPATLSAARSRFSALATHMATAEAGYRYTFAMMDAPQDTDANLVANTTGFGDLANVRVGVGAGFVNVISPITGRTLKRSVAWEATARASRVQPSQDLAAVEDGPLPGVASLVRDERASEGLDGRQGYYLTRGRLLAPAGSDYSLIQNRRVMDIASSVARDRALRFLNSKVPVNANGTIQDASASAIEGYIESGLRGELTEREEPPTSRSRSTA